MSEFGIKIKNIEASTLFEYNNGVRDHYDYKDAMFTNSLFSDFLSNNGLRVWKEESTRDIICLEFNFGSRSFEEELSHLKKISKQARIEYKIAKSHGRPASIEKKYNKRKKISELYREAVRNKEKYNKLSKEEIRKIFYNDGVSVEYISRRKDGEIFKRETIHYKMLYRSTGKAKKGSCMFICDRLYKKAINFLYMGIKLPKKNAPIVEISAYAPLVSSSIIGKIKINPQNILILKDVDRFFRTTIVSIETDENKHCYSKHIDDYDLKNTLFDGQALIDKSIFPGYGNGYVLLRHHFCKKAAFCSDIQGFFRDYFGDQYDTATVTDMFGVVHFVKDIELITTDNAMKWIKFGIPYEYWCDRVRENGCMFGVVKTAHESKLGDVQRMSYQMVNSLDESIMDSVMQRSVDYIHSLKQSNEEFLRFLEKNQNFSNDYEVLIALCRHNPDFVRSSYFRDRKKAIIYAYVTNMRSGKIIQNAENLVIVGSPYAMLLYAATGNPDAVDNDNTFFTEDDCIQCYTERFNSGEYLAFFRSPFNAKNNMVYLHNVYSRNLEKYFNLGRQCVAVNMIGTDFQDRCNGSDQDSDSGYTTNQPDIVDYARYCYLNYPTIVNNIPKERKTYSSSMEDFAEMDNSLSRSQLDIGESSNLAQLAQTYACNFEDHKYQDYVCILSVLAQAAIDSSKRRFDIDIDAEIRRIKLDMDVKENGYPSFWQVINRGFNKRLINSYLHCPMNALYEVKLQEFRSTESTLGMENFFVKHDLKLDRRKCANVEELLEEYSISNYDSIIGGREDSDYLLLRSDFKDLMEDLSKVHISKKYKGLMSWLIDRAFLITPRVKAKEEIIASTLNKNKPLLLKTLYNINKDCFLSCFTKEISDK